MILVTGATGNVGGALVSRLSVQGVPLRALVRSRERADNLRGYDCEIAIGSYEDEASLHEALHGVDRVLLLTPPGERMAEQELALVGVATRVAPQAHVVKVAASGVEATEPSPVRFVRAHQQVVQGLADSGLPTTVLSPTSFMQNLLRQAAEVQEQGVLRTAYGDAALSHVDARDVAAVAAHVLTSDGHEGATYTVTGPEALTSAQVAEVLSRVLGREVRAEDVPPEQVRAGMTASGAPEWLADGMLELYALYRSGGGGTVTDEVHKATGRPARSLEEFVGEHRAAFS